MRIHFKRSYDEDIRLFEDWRRMAKYAVLLAVMIALPALVSAYFLGEVTLVLIYCIAGMGLMILAGHTGQISLGHAAFMAIGAFSNLWFMEQGMSFLLALPLSAVFTGLVGAIIALPILRLSGIYLAIATLALSIIIEDIAIIAEPFTGGVGGVFAPPVDVLGTSVDRYGSPNLFYWMCLSVVVIVLLGYANLLRSATGRSFLAVRDSEVSARALGVNVTRTKALAFGLSCAVTGIAGALYAHFVQVVNYESFLVLLSINLVLLVVIGGLGSIHGAFFGAVVVGLMPQFIAIARDFLQGSVGIDISAYPGLDTTVFAVIIIAMVIYEPLGIYGFYMKIKTQWQLFPLARRDMFRRSKSYLKTERMR
ncbi:branched-chain amino acid transport system permease protein [Monaibacterium marinum]|uniref:Branched-chain amino acid transport system permease protein n=1 Tax=Pontivivens marinum TaxID=1690039 RepID=A0A2C9CRY4_9RHOB|nr:branched-chain amino acid ABC transporter permease [Monaibacterium marinum]SOH93963.1 branched-chain amino acid transport system permease protein [Monaibacterium marinum]